MRSWSCSRRCRRATPVRSAFCRRSALYYQVETLVFGQAVERATKPERTIVGCADPAAPLDPRFRAVLDAFGCPILPMRYESAELAKISINCCLVASVTVGNTSAELCEQIGADWSEIAPALKLDRRIGPYAYLTPGLGIAGGNLERDLATVQRLSDAHGTEAGLISAWLRNSRHRRDWPLRQLHERVLSRVGEPVIGVLGVTYKENTHSIKNSPAVALIKELGEFPAARIRPRGAGRGGMASAHDSGRGRAGALRRRRRPRHHDSLAAVPSAQARRYCRAAARARCDRSLFDVRPCRDGCRRPRTCRTRSAFAGARMTLSHVHNRPRMPDRVVVLGASGFLGRGLARACAAAGIETIGLGSREVDLADAAARRAARRAAAAARTWSCSCRRSRPTRAATPAR